MNATSGVPNTMTSSPMSKEAMSEAIIAAKISKGMTWQAIAEAVGADVVWVTSACFGKNSMPAEMAGKLCKALDLQSDVDAALQSFPHKSWEKIIPQDPLVYRLYEVVGVYGDTIKEVVHEEFGDGIMSAIDFSLNIEKEKNPAGDRVVITMNGKFLPYKTW